MTFIADWGPAILTASVALTGALGSQLIAHRKAAQRDRLKERNDALDRIVDAGHETAAKIGVATGFFLGMQARVEMGGEAQSVLADARRHSNDLVTLNYKMIAACDSFRRRFPDDNLLPMVGVCLAACAGVNELEFKGDAGAYGELLKTQRIAIVDALNRLAGPGPDGGDPVLPGLG